MTTPTFSELEESCMALFVQGNYVALDMTAEEVMRVREEHGLPLEPKKQSCEFVTTCCVATREEVMSYDITEQEIDYAEFASYLTPTAQGATESIYAVPVRDDWAVAFGRGFFRGRPCVVLHHSRIHHFYCEGG